MERSLRDISISNPNRRFDIYYNLPEKQERLDKKRPIGYKHSKASEVEAIFNKIFFKED